MPWARGGAGEGFTSEGAGAQSACTIPFISGSVARAALAGRAGYQIPIAELCNTSICWQGAGASQLSAGRREGVLTFPVRVGCWLCRGRGNAATAINPLERSNQQRGSDKRQLQVPKPQSGVEGYSFSSPLGPCCTKHQYLGLAVLQPREWGTGEGD